MTVSPRRFLFVTWDGGGVVPPTLAVARRLVERGHSVRVLADPTLEAEVIEAGCGFSPWRTAPHRTSRDREADLLRDYAYTNKGKYLDSMMNEFYAVPGPRWTADVLAELDAYPADVVVADSLIPWANMAAESRGIPSVVLSTMVYGVPTPGVPPMGAAMLPVPWPLSVARDAFFRWLFGWLFNKALPSMNAVRASLKLPPLADHHDVARRADRLLVMTSPAFDYADAPVPPNVKWVGAPSADPGWADDWASPWDAADPRPLVLVGLSSTFQDQVPLLRNLVAALSALPVRAVVTRGLTVREDEVTGTENVRVVASAPHGAILPHASVLVTHCGHGTTLKGLAAGVPLLCLPMGRDQDENAARVVQRKAGLKLSPKATVEQLQAAVRRLLDEPGFREGARACAAAIAEARGQADSSIELEAVAAEGWLADEGRAASVA